MTCAEASPPSENFFGEPFTLSRLSWRDSVGASGLSEAIEGGLVSEGTMRLSLTFFESGGDEENSRAVLVRISARTRSIRVRCLKVIEGTPFTGWGKR
jgi:hypothetical protein